MAGRVSRYHCGFDLSLKSAVQLRTNFSKLRQLNEVLFEQRLDISVGKIRCVAVTMAVLCFKSWISRVLTEKFMIGGIQMVDGIGQCKLCLLYTSNQSGRENQSRPEIRSRQDFRAC